MGIVYWIVLGLVAGALAKFIMPGKDPGGCVMTTILGVVGALLGGFLGNFLGFGGLSGFSLQSLLMAVGGSVLLLLLFRIIRGKK
ncbi:MAG: GlsB/YeaQ/YmgE family stress response membrane protein [Acidobacteriota bacterium]